MLAKKEGFNSDTVRSKRRSKCSISISLFVSIPTRCDQNLSSPSPRDMGADVSIPTRCDQNRAGGVAGFSPQPVSIPTRCDQNAGAGGVGIVNPGFQFRHGAIKTKLSWKIGKVGDTFQFRHGAIKTGILGAEEAASRIVSIPTRCDQNCTQNLCARDERKFQFRHGAIKTNVLYFPQSSRTLFQFRHGAIKTSKCSRAGWLGISFNSDTVRSKRAER